MDNKTEFSLLATFLLAGVAFGLVWHLVLMPFFHGWGYCVLTGALFGLLNHLVVRVFYKRNLALQADLKRDKLTDLYNRRAFDRDLANLDRSQEYSLLFIDIDNFKRFNDQFGHQTGDYVLEKVGQSISSLVRYGDKVYRYGGEEIVVFLRDCRKADAVAIGDKICREIASLDNAPFPEITISVGVASFPGDGLSPREIVAASDQALLQAKQEGKNRVVAV